MIEKAQSEGAFSGLNWHWIEIIDRNRRRRRRYRPKAQVLTTWRKASAECQAWPVLPPCSTIMKLFLLVAELFYTCPYLQSYLLTFVLICVIYTFITSLVLKCPYLSSYLLSCPARKGGHTWWLPGLPYPASLLLQYETLFIGIRMCPLMSPPVLIYPHLSSYLLTLPHLSVADCWTLLVDNSLFIKLKYSDIKNMCMFKLQGYLVGQASCCTPTFFEGFFGGIGGGGSATENLTFNIPFDHTFLRRNIVPAIFDWKW